MKIRFFQRAWLQERTPPGLDLSLYCMKLKVLLVISFLFAQAYWSSFVYFRSNLFQNGHLVPGKMMIDFVDVLTVQSSFVPFFGFVSVILAMIYWMFAFYRSFYNDSMSIYTMKRLPDRWELHRRCLTLPLLGIGCVLILMVLTVALFYQLYFLLIPKEAIAPHQLAKLFGLMKQRS